MSDKPDSFLRNDGKEAPEGILVRSPVLAVESRGRDLASRNQVSGEVSVHSITAAQCESYLGQSLLNTKGMYTADTKTNEISTAETGVIIAIVLFAFGEGERENGIVAFALFCVSVNDSFGG